MLYGAAATVIVGIFLIVLAVVDRPNPTEYRNRARRRIRRLLGTGAVVTALGVTALIAHLALGWWE